MSQKGALYLCHIFAKDGPIFILVLPARSLVNFQ